MTITDPSHSEWLTRKVMIDKLLRSCGSRVVPYDAGAGLSSLGGCAVEEFPTVTGPADYALAPVEEQREIIRRVNGSLSPADRLDVRYEKARMHVDNLTRSVHATAFRGELVPTEAELTRRGGRSHETAEALPARIATSHLAAPTSLRRGARRA